MKRLLGILLLILLAGVAGLGYLGFLAIENNPLVTDKPLPANSQQAERVNGLMKRLIAVSKLGQPRATLSVSEQDLESLLAFAARGVPSVRADAQITTQGMDARLTLELPANPLGRYFNFSFGLLPSDHGLLLSHVTLGRASLPPAAILPLLGWGLDALLGEGGGGAVTGAITAVRFSGKEMVINYEPQEGMSEKLLSRITDNEQLQISDPQTVQIYFTRLQEIAAELRGGYAPLTRYLAPVFELAAKRSAIEGADAASENKAAILAMAIYFGDKRMAKLAGNSKDEYFTGSRLGSHNVTVKGRHDLVQHYLTSAGLHLAAGEGIANAIGEFKEIADTLRGGSGFSFSDIAGDRAGVLLAVHAASSDNAARIQGLLSRAKNEADFFPDITGLPDNMTQAEFERRYGDVESQRYRELMADIEKRILQIPVYGGG